MLNLYVGMYIMDLLCYFVIFLKNTVIQIFCGEETTRKMNTEVFNYNSLTALLFISAASNKD